MKEDPRIKLLKNLENKGTFYSRAKGVLNAKGKYILFLDVDDLYTSKDAFSTLYKVAEKYDLDILSFACITNDRFILNKKLRIIYYYETPILFQPNISERVYYIDKNGEVVNYGNVLWCYLFRKKVVLDSLKEIPKKFFDVKISHHDDILLLFVITRKAKSMKYLKRIFHIYLSHHPNETSTIYKNNRVIYKIKTVCLSNIYFLEFLLLKTKDTFEDKMIVSSETERWYLNNSCIDDELAKKEGIQYCKQLLQNKYIKYDIKRKIELYLSKII
jgi:glycosyltransferase involved in cell wall biosynthesis